jgi:hypothetical protein
LLSCWLGFKPRANTTNLEEVVSGDAHQRSFEQARAVLFLAQH